MQKPIKKDFFDRMQTISEWLGKDEALVYIKLRAGKAKIDRIAFLDEEEEDEEEGVGPIMELNTNIDLRKTLSYLG